MNIYKIGSLSYDDDEMNTIYVESYLFHEEKFTKVKFSNMCQEGIKALFNNNIDNLESFLIKNYGFRKIELTQTFGVEEF